MTTRRVPAAPRHLSAETRAWWRQVLSVFELHEPHHVRLLEAAGMAWDRAAEARELLAKDGPVMTDRFGIAKEHPAASIERQSLALFAKLCRELGLDLQEPTPPRLPTRWRN